MNILHLLASRDSLDSPDSPNSPDLSDDDDSSYGSPMAHLLFVFFTLLFVASLLSLVLIYLRRKRRAQQPACLPVYNHSAHHRSVSVINFPTQGRTDAVFVYDEKMNLIANSSSPPSSNVPEIRITFPDEEDVGGAKQKGRVVVVHVTDSGSVGMAPLQQDTLPPYQRTDAERFQSIDLERIGGLREKQSPQRWS